MCSSIGFDNANLKVRGAGRTAASHLMRTASFMALAALPTLAHADETETPRPEILITGTRNDQYSIENQETALRLPLSLKETPQAVTVVTSAQIEDFHLDTVNDLLRQTNGVNVDNFDTERTYFNARGFDIVNFQYDGIGMPMSEGLQLGALDTSIYDRIEVVRGSTGLLSQTGNPSAVVNFVRKRATGETGGTASLSYGSFEEVNAQTDINAALTADGGLRARFVGAYETGDSYLDFYHTSRFTLYGTVSADLGPGTVLTAGYSWYESDPHGVTWGGLPTTWADGSEATYARSATTAQPWTSWNSIDRNLFADITHDFGKGWTGKVSVLRRARDQDAKLFYVYGNIDPDTGEGLYTWPGAYLDSIRETTVDGHLSGKFTLFGREHEALFGATYGVTELTEQEAEAADATGLAINAADALGGGFAEPEFGDYTVQAQYTTKLASAYGMVRLSLADPLKLILGGSVVNARRSGTSYGAPYNFEATRALPYAGVTYDLTGNLTAYASYATIYNPQTSLGEDLQPLDPLEGDTYEAGLKGQWLGGKLNASVALFRTHQANVAEYVGYVSGQYIYKGTDATSRGVEFDVMGEVLPGLQASGGYTYTDIQDQDGNPSRTFIPRHTAKLALTYVPQALPALRLGAAVRFQSQIENTIVQEGYAIADLMARYQLLKNVSLAVNVNNVTDVKYWQSLQYGQSTYGAPRTWKATLAVNF